MVRKRREQDFVSMFDDRTGLYLRTGVIRDGRDTGEDPFMASFPELLDVGIMGHCIHGKEGLCLKAGVECYQDGLHSRQSNMELNDFMQIVEQCRGRTYQIALGGCGDPDMHEHFEEILKACRDNGIVPNFTTSGLGMTAVKALICGKYCGAVAVSWYRSDYTLKAISMLIKAGVKTNIHYVVSNSTIDEAVEMLINNRFPQGINAVVFLLHKPVGLGTPENVINPDDERMNEFIRLAVEQSHPFKVGFDSCTVPALVNMTGGPDIDCVDTCEGARWSAYISADLDMMPCSFDNRNKRWAVSLRDNSIKQAWDSNQFENFRNLLRNACPDCAERAKCMGGCPICPEIVLCSKRG